MTRSQYTRTVSALLVIAASLYSFALCCLYAIGLPISNGVVAGVDGAIVIGALLTAGLIDPGRVFLPIAALVLNFVVVSFFAQEMDLKSLRDGLVICAFLSLGFLAGNIHAARWTLFTVAAFAAALGVFEAANPELYGSTFQVLQFYIMRGAVDPGVAAYTDTSLFVSSMRGEARNLLPFLGTHRVSSVFLEPVSMGNFGAIALAFGLSLGPAHKRTAIAAGTIGIAAILAADARFAAVAALLFAAARFIPTPAIRLVLLPMPFLAVAMLLAAATFIRVGGDDLPTRLAASGAVIAGLDLGAVFGLTTPGRESLDSGYAYALAAFGLPFCVLMWLAFVFLPTPGPQAARYKLLLGIYICALLCISGSSLFALKTAALAWFLFGALLSEERAPVRAWRPAAHLQAAPA